MRRMLNLAVPVLLVVAAWWWWTHNRPLGPEDLGASTALHVPRHAMPAVVLDGQVWVVGGYSETGRVASIEVIDPATGRSTVRDTGLIPRMYHAALVHEGRIWVLGGSTPRVNNERQLPAAIETYDPVSRDVTTVAWLPFPGNYRAAVVFSNRLYVIGGTDRDGIPTGRMDIYDIAADTWSRGPDMPTPRQCAVVVQGGRLHALGGYNGYEAINTVEVFDPATGAWSVGPPLPGPQSAHRAVTAPDGSVLLVGDYAQGNLIVHGDPETGRWRALDVPFTGARHLAAAVVGNDLVIAGGRAADREELFPPHLGGIHVFPLNRLLRAPTRALPVIEPADARQEAMALMAHAIGRQARLTTVAMSGHWDIAYEAEGRAWTNRTVYQFVLERPNRLFIESDPYTAWHDGSTFTFRFTRDGTYQRQEGGVSLDHAVKRGYGWFRQSLPFGHGALLGSDGVNAWRSTTAYRPMWYEGEGRWRGRATWVMRSQATNDPALTISPDFRVHIDQASGISVLIESLPWTDGRDAWPGRDDESAVIARTLVYRFELDGLTLDEPVDMNVFAFAPRAQDRDEVGRRGGTGHAHPQGIGDLAASIYRHNHAAEVFPDLPAERFDKVWEATPEGLAAGSVTRRFSALVSAGYHWQIDQGSIRVWRIEDGASVMRVPAPDLAAGPLRPHAGAYLPRRDGDGVWIAVPPRPADQQTSRLAVMLNAFDETGTIAWSRRLPASRRAPELAVVPLAPGAGHGVFAFTYDRLVLIDDTGSVLLDLPIDTNVLMEATDRDGDGRLEITLHENERIRRFVYRDEAGTAPRPAPTP